MHASLTTTMEGARKAALAQMVLVTALFGGTWPAGKIAVDHLPPLTVAAARFVLATVLLFALAVARAPPSAAAVAPRPAADRGARADRDRGLPGAVPGRPRPDAGERRRDPRARPDPGAHRPARRGASTAQRPTRRVATGFAIALVGLVVVVDPTGAVGGDAARRRSPPARAPRSAGRSTRSSARPRPRASTRCSRRRTPPRSGRWS